MGKIAKILALTAIIFSISFVACNKDEYKTDKDYMDYEVANDLANLFINSEQYESNITSGLVKPDDYEFYTEGIIEYLVDDQVVAVVDFGNGDRDQIATKIIDGSSTEIDLTHKGKKSDYVKVIIKPLVKITGCDYIVSGIIKYKKDGLVIATVDYGDGTCDEWATKTWDGGSKVFSMKKTK